MKLGFAAALVYAAPSSFANAQATPSPLAPRQCLSMAEMNAALRAEGQRTMIIGNRSAVQERDAAGNPTRVVENVETITSNADGSIGYNLSGNRPREEPSTNVCVGAKLTNIRLYDASQPVIPRDAYLGGSFNTLVNDNDERGTRPMVIADTVFPNGSGGTRLGRPIVIFGNVEGRSGSLLTYTANNEPARLALLVSTDYTQAALDLLRLQSQSRTDVFMMSGRITEGLLEVHQDEYAPVLSYEGDLRLSVRCSSWLSATQNFAGETMTGLEWLRLVKSTSTPDARASWREAMMSGGRYTRSQIFEIENRMRRLDALTLRSSECANIAVDGTYTLVVPVRPS